MTDTPTPTPTTGAEQPLSLERALLAVDVFSGLLGELSRYQEEAAAWSARMADHRALELSEAEAKEHGLGAGHDWTTGPLRLPQPPSQSEMVAYIFPSLWGELRPQIVRTAAIFLLTNEELEGAWDDAGDAGYDEVVSGLISDRVREVRFRMAPGDVAKLVLGVLERERGPLLEALGEGRALVADATGAKKASANGSASPSVPATGRRSSTGSGSSTAGRRRSR